MTRAGIERIDDLDILSAIWILSCNDENPILTYRSIGDRLNLDSVVDVRSLVRSRRELFRPGVLKSRLDKWKLDMQAGARRPAWIQEIGDDAERNKAIDALSEDDVFRNQFRVAPNSPKCSLEIIDWGLQHLERLRKGAFEAREEGAKKWTTLVLPAMAVLSSLLLGIASLGASIYIQRASASDTRELKQYEVGFKPKQEGYSAFMSALQDAALATFSGDEAKLVIQFSRMEASYHGLEPFLVNEQSRDLILDTFNDFSHFCTVEVRKKPPIIGADSGITDTNRYQTVVKRMAGYKKSFHDQLFGALFPK